MPAWLIPAAISAGTALASHLAGQRQADIRRQRIEGVFRGIEENRTRRIAEATKKIGTYTAGLRKGAEAKAARLEMASGREGSATALAPVLTGKVARAGSNALENALTSINEQADREKMNAEYAKADEPIEPGFFDYVGEVGQGASRFLALQNMMEPDQTALAAEKERLGGFENPVTGETDLPVTVEPYQGQVYQPGQSEDYRSLRATQGITGAKNFGSLYNKNNYLSQDVNAFRTSRRRSS